MRCSEPDPGGVTDPERETARPTLTAMARPAPEPSGTTTADRPRGRGRPAASDSRGTKATILNAALRLFGNGSYDAISMATVATEAGVDKRTVHYHFGS